MMTAVLSVLLVAAFFIGLFSFVDLTLVWQQIKRLEVHDYAVFVCFACLSYLARLARWHVLMRDYLPLRAKVIHLHQIYLLGFVLSATPAKIGETLRSVFLKRIGIDYAPSLAAFFAERLQDLLVVLLLAAVALSLMPEYSLFFIMAASLILFVFLLLSSNTPHQLLLSLMAWLSKKLRIKMSKQHFLFDLDDFFVCLKSFLSLSYLPKTVPLTLFGWLSQVAVLHFVLSAFDVGTDWPWYIVVGIYGLSTLLGALSFVPAGLGATEASLSLLLISQGVDAEIAVAVSLIFRLCTLWLAIGIGLIALFHWLLFTKTETNN
ncbi:flippase-like domain-containing protein [Catenovulum sp. SM1970]|uniref:lysylphosphatidylglycerol synthase transmembrane domain-containing protein n=1 Tax=Marinifaba aquimaris TaxID=2741323 RepID=UPI001574088D|nr:lysylphosphatidylglycerol synthase transmembrane domain-containing protein [Marinifaba aquimaris]NTS75943.1 flippase-like domain-containing protein [Marinifaba aquimaris]